MIFTIVAKGRKHRFETLTAACAAAAHIFAVTGIVVGIETESAA